MAKLPKTRRATEGSTPAASTNITDGCDAIRGRVTGLGPRDPDQLSPRPGDRPPSVPVSQRSDSSNSVRTILR